MKTRRQARKARVARRRKRQRARLDAWLGTAREGDCVTSTYERSDGTTYRVVRYDDPDPGKPQP